MVAIEGGKILHCSPVACAPGTSIEVKSLFFNVPVRRKFQKSPAYDANEIQKMVTLLALGYPEIKFQLISNEKTVWQTSVAPTDSFEAILGERIAAVLGREYFDELCLLSSEKDQCSLNGYVGMPSSHRQNRTGQYLFINRRAVISPFVAYAVREGYGPSIPPNRYPIFVLHLNLPGEWIDVNVHPQKKEVRLRQESFFKNMIVKAVEKSMQAHNPFSISVNMPSIDFNPSPTWEFQPAPLSFNDIKPILPHLEASKERISLPVPAPAPLMKTHSEIKEEVPNLFQSEPKPQKAIPKVLTTLPGISYWTLFHLRLPTVPCYV